MLNQFELPRNSVSLEPRENEEDNHEDFLFEEIGTGEIPDAVARDLYSRYVQFTDEAGKELGEYPLDYVARITHNIGDVTYVAEHEKVYSANDDTERCTYFYDLLEGEVAGYAELRINLTKDSEYFKEKPFVGYTKTEDAFLRRGLALRRVRMMAQYVRERYSLPLYSDTLLSEEVVELWKKLVSDGKAEEIREGDHVRYRTLV